MVRIKIELDAWEDTPCPICTENVDLDSAEKALYSAMRTIHGYDDRDIKRFLKGKGTQDEIETFNECLCKEEEECILEWGGVYYEDMEDYEDE